jgi:hypothetical protein
MMSLPSDFKNFEGSMFSLSAQSFLGEDYFEGPCYNIVVVLLIFWSTSTNFIMAMQIYIPTKKKGFSLFRYSTFVVSFSFVSSHPNEWEVVYYCSFELFLWWLETNELNFIMGNTEWPKKSWEKIAKLETPNFLISNYIANL